jgi:phosphonatase-like hydrolase
LVADIHDVFVANMIEYYKQAPGIAPMEDSEKVFAKLQEMGIKIGLDTGFSRDITDVILERVGWKDSPLIDVTVASDEVERGRPFPDMIQRMMEMLEINDTREIIKIGDTEVDVNEGHQTGCLMSIAVTTGAYTEEELRKHHPTHVINSLSELIPIVESCLE